MAAIILPDKWRRQPSGLVTVDAANGLARGLFSFVTSAGGVARDLQAGINAQLSADAKVSPTVAGLGVTLDGTGDYASAGAYNKGNFFFSAGQSVFFEIVPAFSSASNTRQGVIHFANGTASGDIPRLRVIWLSASSGFYVDTKDGYAYSAAPSFAAGDVVRGIFTRTGINGGQWQFFNRGATSTKVDDSGDGYAFSGADPSLYLGWDAENASWVMAGSIITTAAWSRGLSTGEAQAVLENPYQLLRKQPRILYFNVAGGGASISGALESISLATFGATVASARDIAAALESVALTTSTARVSTDRAVTAAVESITISTSAATVSSDRAIAGAVESVALTTNPATVALGATIGAATEAVSLTTNAATVALDASIAATLEAITVTGLTATVSTSSDTNISAALESITVTVNPATVARDSALAAALESITVTPLAASVAVGSIIGAALEALTLTSYPAGVALNVTLGTQLEQLNLATFAAQVGLGTNVAALTEALTLTPHGATLTFTSNIGAATEHLTLTTFAAVVGASEAALLSPGLEFTIPLSRMGYTIPVSRVHFTIPDEG